MINTSQVNGSMQVAGGSPNGVFPDPIRPRVYVADAASNSLLILNATDHQEITRILEGLGPYGMDISSDRSELYVTLNQGRGLAVVDLGALQSLRVIPLGAAAYEVTAGRLGRAYVTTDQRNATIVDTAGGTIVGKVEATDFLATFNRGLARVSPDWKTLYLTTWNLSPPNIYSFNVTTDNPVFISQTIHGSINALADMDIDPTTGYIYVPGADNNDRVTIIDPKDWTHTGTLFTGWYTNSVSLAEEGKIVFANYNGYSTYQLAMFNATDRIEVRRWSISRESVKVRALEDSSKVYVITLDFYGRNPLLEMVDTVNPIWPEGSALIATDVNATSLTLAWTSARDNVAIAAYRVYLAGTLMATLPGSYSNYRTASNALSPDKLYTFHVEAGDASDNWSTDGPSVTVRTSLPPSPPGLYYNLYYTTPVYPGGTSVLMNWFNNTSGTRVRILSVSVVSDFGSYSWNVPTPCSICESSKALDLNPGQKKVLNVTATIPATAFVGNHTITATVNFQYFYHGYIAEWQDGGPLVAQGFLRIETAPPPQPRSIIGTLLALGKFVGALRDGLASPVFPVLLAAYIAMVSIVSYLVVRDDEKKRKLILQ